MNAVQERGIPYSIDEARMLVAEQGFQHDPYAVEIIRFLLKRIEELEAEVEDVTFRYGNNR